MDEETICFEGSFSAARPRWISDEFGTATGKEVKIGVLDSGWSRRIRDSRVKKGISFIDPFDELRLGRSEDDNDCNGHGTACTEVILRIAPLATIYPIRVFGKRIETSPSIVVKGIDWAINQGLKVLNVSLSTMLSEALEPLYAVCEKARRHGIIIVAAKPNSGESGYPAIFENAIGVESGVFRNIFQFRFVKDEAIECKAAGHFNDLLSLGGERIPGSGNSLAAPVITGIVALLAEKCRGFPLDDIRSRLEQLSTQSQEFP